MTEVTSVRSTIIKLGEVLRQMNTYSDLAFSRDEYGIRVLLLKQEPPAHYVDAFTNERIQLAAIDETYGLRWLNTVVHEPCKGNRYDIASLYF